MIWIIIIIGIIVFVVIRSEKLKEAKSGGSYTSSSPNRPQQNYTPSSQTNTSSAPRSSTLSGIPYSISTEFERNTLVPDGQYALKGSVDDILKICFFYKNTEQDEGKFKFWFERFEWLAKEGNLVAQAASYSPISLTRFFYSTTTRDYYRGKYKENIQGLANRGDAKACLALGMYPDKQDANVLTEVMPLLQKAASGGLTDAWCKMGDEYEHLLYYTETGEKRVTPLGEESEYYRSAISCYRKGIEANNGALVEKCKYELDLLLY